MTDTQRPLAVVTGASTGIGYELALCCAREGFDLVVAADEDRIMTVQKDFAALGNDVKAIKADLSTVEGVDALYAAIKKYEAKTGVKVDTLRKAIPAGRLPAL